MWTCWECKVMEITDEGQLVVNYSCPERPDDVIGVLISLPEDRTLATPEWIEQQMEVYSVKATVFWDKKAKAEAAVLKDADTLVSIKGITKSGHRPVEGEGM